MERRQKIKARSSFELRAFYICMDRPESQLHSIGLGLNALMDFKVLLRVPNRDIALFVEKVVIFTHFTAFGEFPPYNKELFTRK